MESFLLPGLCFLACLWTPQAPRPMELNEVTSGIFSQCTWLVIPHTRLGASVVSPDNFWETQVSQQGLALKSAHPAVFLFFLSSLCGCPLAPELLCPCSCSAHNFYVFPKLKDLPCCLHFKPKGAESWCVLHNYGRQRSLVKAQM